MIWSTRTMAISKLRSALLCVLLLLPWPVLAADEPEKFREFIRAVADGQYLAVERMLDEGQDPNGADEQGTSALMAAVAFNRLGIAKLLVDRGGDVNAARSSSPR